MISKLVEFAICKRAWVVLLFVFIGMGSVWSLRSAHIDAIPDIGDNQQIVFSEWPGRTPKDIEEQVTYPLSVALQGIPGVKTVRGVSAFGFSSISIIFEDNVDYYWSRSRVLEKLSVIREEVPPDVQTKMGPDATGLGQIFWYTLENKPHSESRLSLAELRSLQDFYVKRLLQGVPGVSEVGSIGGFVKEYQIDVDPYKLSAFDVHFSDLIRAIQSSNLDVGAEVIEDGDREFLVRGKGFFRSLEDIENVVVAIRSSSPVRVRDLATVGTGPAFRRGALDDGGTETVGGVVAMRFGENPQIVIDALKKQIEILKKGLPEGVELRPFYDRTEVISRTIGTVHTALVQQIFVTILVILLFLMHLRSSVLVSLTLPLGVGLSFILMKALDIDANVMSLSGLVIAIGSMVDMGIIMTENIYSRLAEERPQTLQERVKIATQAATEVGPAIMTAAMTTVVTFLPVFALTGAEGKLFGPLAWAKTLAMLGAVFVALTLIPALSVFALKGNLKPIEKNPVSRSIVNGYRPLLQLVLRWRWTFLLLPIALIIGGTWSFTRLGKEFMPSLNEGDILYMPVTTADISMTKARELLSYTDQVILEHPLVERVVGKLGRVNSALDPAPIGMFETLIVLKPESDWPEGKTIQDIMAELDESVQIPGLVNSWDFPIQTRIAMISTGIRTQVGVKIFGDDLTELERLASEVGDVLNEIEGALGVYAERIAGKPYIEFEVDRVAASRYGINVGTVNNILQTAVGGMPIGQFFEGRERYPIRVRYKKELRDRIDDLKQVLVPSPLGSHIPIEQLADIKIVTGPAAIQSENGLLRAVVQSNVQGRDVIGFVEEARRKVEASVSLPPGYSMMWAGQYENQERANVQLMFLIPLSLLVNLIIIKIGLGSIRNASIVFLAVPVSMSGGLLLLDLFGYNTSVAVWVGFIALFGIAVDDGVVMMTYLRKSIQQSKPQNREELFAAILEAGSRRIRPLVMTTTTTLIALAPVLWSSTTGSEIMKPMAIPALGGMLVELITLFVVPAVFSIFEEIKITRRENLT